VCLALEQVAKEVGVECITAVAIAYVLHKTPYVFPLIGGRKVEYLKQNIQALDISLSPEQIRQIDGAEPFNAGFPHDIFVPASTQFPCTNPTDRANKGTVVLLQFLEIS